MLESGRGIRLLWTSGLRLHAIIDEGVLRRTVGGPDIMASQLKHLASMAKHANVTLQVAKPEDGPHPATTTGKFAIFEFENAGPVAYVELFDNAIYVQDDGDVSTYRLFADGVGQVALSPEESLRLIRATMNRK